VFLLLAGLFLAAASPGRAQASTILAVTVDGVITPVMADHIRDVLDRAEGEGPKALLVQLDTPGGRPD
jgi:membrane-bound ClpP family serine protease